MILHVDMDAFFASVEQRDHPEWRGKPVIVGADPHERGVVSTCSYEARKFGVHSAMPSRTAFAYCPTGIFVRPRMDVYSAVSREVFAILGSFSPFVEKVSVDEAYLDISGTSHLFGGDKSLGEKLRAAVREKVGLTCSVGIANNRLMAKIGSEEAKPDGLVMMPTEPDAMRDFLAPKPIGILWGVGKKTEELLTRAGFRICADLQRADPRFLTRLLGPAQTETLMNYAFGRASDVVISEAPPEKSISRENTFGTDESNREAVRQTLIELVEEVGRQVREMKRWARVAKIKLRDGAFNTITRQAHFELPTRDTITFRHLALDLFDKTWPKGVERIVRLIGFGVGDFTENPGQGEDTLFGPDARVKTRIRREHLSEVLDHLRIQAPRTS